MAARTYPIARNDLSLLIRRSTMRVLKKSLKEDDGEITLLAESLDDLWHLKHLVAP